MSKKIYLPGFDKMPLYDITSFFLRAIRNGSITMRASSLSFKFFLAVFPALIFLFSLLPYIPVDNFQAILLAQLKHFMPANAYALAQSTIEDLVVHKRGGLLSLGFIMTVYVASNGINAMISAFNKSYFTIEKRSAFKQRLVAFELIFILTFLLFIAIFLIIFGKLILNWLMSRNYIQSDSTIILLQLAKWIIVVLLIYFSFSFIYFLGPSRKIKWRFFSPGSTLATILTIAVSIGFAYFVNNFGQYNKLYGSIGSLIVILLWIYFVSIILLTGFELNASVLNAKKVRGSQAAKQISARDC
ncbi:MAG: YihY/virulence factor BrkB family protein [Flavobacteriales bacterium]